MEQGFQQLEKILRSFQAKTLSAREALELDSWDEFDQAMRWKKAAFHNFRALDHVLESKQPGYLAAGPWRDLWRDIEEADRLLTAEIERQKEKLNRQLVSIRSHKQALSKFQSGVIDTTGFQETV